MDDLIMFAEDELVDAGAKVQIFADRIPDLSPVEVKFTFYDEDGRENSLIVDMTKNMTLNLLDDLGIYLGQLYVLLQDLKEEDEEWELPRAA